MAVLYSLTHLIVVNFEGCARVNYCPVDCVVAESRVH